jgi:hypothetical protein
MCAGKLTIAKIKRNIIIIMNTINKAMEQKEEREKTHNIIYSVSVKLMIYV